MSTNRWRDNEVVVYIYNGLLFSHKKEHFLGFILFHLSAAFNLLGHFLILEICFFPWHEWQHITGILPASLFFLPVTQMVKNLPAMQETWVRSLGQEDPLEKEMATHSSIFAWKIPKTEETGRLQSIGSQRVGHDWAISLSWFVDSFSWQCLFPYTTLFRSCIFPGGSEGKASACNVGDLSSIPGSGRSPGEGNGNPF